MIILQRQLRPDNCCLTFCWIQSSCCSVQTQAFWYILSSDRFTFPIVKCSLIAFKIDSCGTVGHKPTTSAVIRIELLGILLRLLILLIKSLESLMADHPPFIIGFKWKSTNSDTFSIGVPQSEMAGFPCTVSDL